MANKTRKTYKCIPVPSYFVKFLPKDRPFSKVEAYLSLRVDHRAGNSVSVMGYTKRWGWSREKVRKFIEDMHFQIVYPRDTRTFKKQWGYLQKRHNEPKQSEGLRTEKDIKHKERHNTSKDNEDLQATKDIRPDTTILYKSIDKEHTTAQTPPLEEGGSAAVDDGETLTIANGEQYPKHCRAPLFNDGLQAILRKNNSHATCDPQTWRERNDKPCQNRQ